MAERKERPRSERAKEQYVERLFASIAARYDLLNSVISFNRHKSWRRFAVKAAGLAPGNMALDVAAGTGDFSFELAGAVGGSGEVVALDLCPPMIEIGRRKAARRGAANVRWTVGNAADLPFRAETFDCAVIGFALRNVANVQRTIEEMTRVVKRGGRVISLEIIRPTSRLFRPLWAVYFNGLLPGIAGIFGGKREAYTYLPESVKRFYSRQELSQIMLDAGLTDVRVHALTMGVVCAHVGVKL
ncbi:MAG: ubiquinone/menaquinone biosynthesis methyltransferase [Armatimonadota bacterium]|nr:ubiquinone/menaquinone biosynthesis methyltransferase [Armatimonadota bacterium]